METKEGYTYKYIQKKVRNHNKKQNENDKCRREPICNYCKEAKSMCVFFSLKKIAGYKSEKCVECEHPISIFPPWQLSYYRKRKVESSNYMLFLVLPKEVSLQVRNNISSTCAASSRIRRS